MIKVEPINPDNTPLFDCDNCGTHKNLFEIQNFIMLKNKPHKRNGTNSIFCKTCLAELQTKINDIITNSTIPHVGEYRYLVCKNTSNDTYYVAKAYCKKITKINEGSTNYVFKYTNYAGYCDSITLKNKGVSERIFINEDDALAAANHK